MHANTSGAGHDRPRCSPLIAACRHWASAFLCVGGLTALTGTASACTALPGPTSGADQPATTPSNCTNAAIIVAVGARRGIPIRGLIIAVATAMQESGLRNLGDLGDRNDHDSLGLFQQRPSQGWGTPAADSEPRLRRRQVLRQAPDLPNWEQLPLTEAAQAVQNSAYPDAYAKHDPDATPRRQRCSFSRIMGNSR